MTDPLIEQIAAILEARTNDPDNGVITRVTFSSDPDGRYQVEVAGTPRHPQPDGLTGLSCETALEAVYALDELMDRRQQEAQ